MKNERNENIKDKKKKFNCEYKKNPREENEREA